MSIKMKSELEADISKSIADFEKKQFGKNPTEVRTFIVQDMILIQITGILSPSEKNMVSKTDGFQLIKDIRMRLIESSLPILEKNIEEIAGASINNLHSDIITETGERFLILTLNKDLEEELKMRIE